MNFHDSFRRPASARYALSVAAMLAAGVLAGCAVGPDFKPSAAPEVGSFTRGGEADRPADAPPVAPDWWRAYSSERVSTLVERALAHNPGLDAGLANLRQAQENVRAQQGLAYPQVQAMYSVNRQNAGTVQASPLNSGASLFTLHTAQLNVGFVPDVFGGNRRQIESLKAAADAQRYQVDALRVTVAANVTAAAIQEEGLLAQLQVAEEATKVAQEQVIHSRRLRQAGYIGALELAQQEAAYAQTATLAPPLRKQLQQTRDLLAVLCGSLPSDTSVPLGSISEIRLPATLPATLPSELVRQRPDVQAADAQLHAAYAQVGVAMANRLPQFTLSANLAYTGPMLAGLLAGPNQAWSLLGGLTAPIFSGGTLSARQRAAEAAAQAAHAQYQGVVLTAFQNVADTLHALQADDEAMRRTEEAETANRRQLDLTQKQQQEGYVALPQLLLARQTWLQSRLGALAAKTNYLGDTVALYQALGGGWRAEAEATQSAQAAVATP